MSYSYSDELYSDLHKDVHGFRPKEFGWSLWEEKTPAEKQVEWDILCVNLEKQENSRNEAEAKEVAKFEARVDKIAACTTLGTREDAIRWLFLAEEEIESVLDPDYYCFKYGLPYGYFKKYGMV